MSRRKRFEDQHKIGHSSIVPIVPGESTSERHERRLLANLGAEESVREWCVQNKIKLTITNHGHHWQLILGKQRAEWWPSSAKLIFNKEWRKGIHCHDYTQLKQVVTEKWKLE